MNPKAKYQINPITLECSQCYEFYETDIGDKTPAQYIAETPLCQKCGGRLI